MRRKNALRYMGNAMVASALAAGLASTTRAENADLARHPVLGSMASSEHFPFVAGIIEGIAYHRYVSGNKDAAGMNCIYDWFYKNDKTIAAIYVALAEYPEHPPAAVVAALANKNCNT